MELAVYNKAGVDTGRKAELNDAIFAAEPNDHAIYLDVKHFMACNRQGTHKSKEKGEVSGSTRKLKRQKGTGTARAGSIKSPLFRGGGRVFGPRPRDYSFKLNKKVKQLARKSALVYKMRENKVMVIENLNFDAPKTKEIIELKNNLKINNKKSIFILSEENKNVYLSSRNLKNTRVIVASELTTYDIAGASALLFTESSIEVFEKLFKV